MTEMVFGPPKQLNEDDPWKTTKIGLQSVLALLRELFSRFWWGSQCLEIPKKVSYHERAKMHKFEFSETCYIPNLNFRAKKSHFDANSRLFIWFSNIVLSYKLA